MSDLNRFAKLDFEEREYNIKNGDESRAKVPTLVKVDIPGLVQFALKWFGGREGEEAKEQFFFSVFPPIIKEWENTELWEWCVVGVGKWSTMKDAFPEAFPKLTEYEGWVVVIAVNHSLRDAKGHEMFGRFYVAHLATRLMHTSEGQQNIVPKKFLGEVKFHPL